MNQCFLQKNRKRRNRKKKSKQKRALEKKEQAEQQKEGGDKEKDKDKDKDKEPEVEIEYVTEEPEIYDPNFIFFKRIFEAFKVRRRTSTEENSCNSLLQRNTTM